MGFAPEELRDANRLGERHRSLPRSSRGV